MNRRIAIIITTDFCCWVPFIITCFLHYLEVVDATPWYGIFSMIILPINSVINPFLYDDVVISILGAPLHSMFVTITSSAIYQGFVAHFRSADPEVIEMEQVEVREDGAGSGAGCSLTTLGRGARAPIRTGNCDNQAMTPDLQA